MHFGPKHLLAFQKNHNFDFIVFWFKRIDPCLSRIESYYKSDVSVAWNPWKNRCRKPRLDPYQVKINPWGNIPLGFLFPFLSFSVLRIESWAQGIESLSSRIESLITKTRFFSWSSPRPFPFLWFPLNFPFWFHDDYEGCAYHTVDSFICVDWALLIVSPDKIRYLHMSFFFKTIFISFSLFSFLFLAFSCPTTFFSKFPIKRYQLNTPTLISFQTSQSTITSS